MNRKDDIVVKRTKREEKMPISVKTIGLSVLVLIFVMVLSAVVAELSGISVADIGKKAESGKLIYDSLPDSIKDIESSSGRTVLLTDTAVDYIDGDGNLLSSNAHLYSQPVIKVNDSTVLVYDRGGTSFRIERKGEIYNTYDVAGPIITASIGKKNNYCYVMNSEGGFQSHLFVYSYQGKKQFEWGSASDYCVSTALSDNGKNIAVALVGVDNGEYYSKITFFNFRKNEPVYTVKFPDCTVFGLDFISNKKVAALTDNGIFVINNDGQYEKVCDYTHSEIKHSSFLKSKLNAMVIANHGNEKDTDIIVLNKKYEELFRVNSDSEVFAVRTTDSFTAVVYSNEVHIFGEDGEKTASITVGEKCVDAAFSGRTLYLRTVGGIYCFDADAEIDLTAVTEEETEEKKTEEATEIKTESNNSRVYG